MLISDPCFELKLNYLFILSTCSSSCVCILQFLVTETVLFSSTSIIFILDTWIQILVGHYIIINKDNFFCIIFISKGNHTFVFQCWQRKMSHSLPRTFLTILFLTLSLSITGYNPFDLAVFLMTSLFYFLRM